MVLMYYIHYILKNKHISVRSSIFDSLKIYIPGASCVLFVSVLLTAVIIVLKRKSSKLQKGTSQYLYPK